MSGDGVMRDVRFDICRSGNAGEKYTMISALTRGDTEDVVTIEIAQIPADLTREECLEFVEALTRILHRQV